MFVRPRGYVTPGYCSVHDCKYAEENCSSVYTGVELFVTSGVLGVRHHMFYYCYETNYNVFFPGILIMVHWQRSLDMKLPTDSTIEVFIFLGARGIKVHDTIYNTSNFMNMTHYELLGRSLFFHFLWKKKSTADHTVLYFI